MTGGTSGCLEPVERIKPENATSKRPELASRLAGVIATLNARVPHSANFIMREKCLETLCANSFSLWWNWVRKLLISKEGDFQFMREPTIIWAGPVLEKVSHRSRRSDGSLSQ